MTRLTRWTVSFLLLATFVCSARAQTCLTRDSIPASEGTALENSSHQLFDQARRGDLEALRKNSIPSLQSNFDPIAAAVRDNQAALAGANAQVREMFLLETGSSPTPDGRFFCGVFGANGPASNAAEFDLPRLPAGRYGIVVQDMAGAGGPYALTAIFQDINGWKLAGFYIRPQTAAGHNGQWFLDRAKEFAAKGQLHNAWLSYGTAWDLLAPVTFMDNKMLSGILSDANRIQPKDFPANGNAVDFLSEGRTYRITQTSVFSTESTLDFSLRYSVSSTADFSATQAEARRVANAFVARYPELKEAFNNLWVHAVDPQSGDVPAVLPLKPAAAPSVPGPDPKFAEEFRKQVEEVTLLVTAVDKRQLVTNLSSSDFLVYEDDKPQAITAFRSGDAAASLGIIVDNSGSMRQKRAAVARAALNLVKASNKDDEVFIVNFNDEPYLDQDFTNDPALMQEALDRLDSRGGTALYDAVIASAEHMARAAKREKRILLVITDGEDNESQKSLEQAIREVQSSNGPAIYAVGILGATGKQRRAQRALEALSSQTGGVAFFPKSLTELDAVLAEVSSNIRNQYIIHYKPSNPQLAGGYRQLKVVTRAPQSKNMQIRVRSGYFAR